MIPNGVIGSLTCDSDSEGLFKAGCVQQFGSYIKSHAVSLGAAGIALAVIQVKFLFHLFAIQNNINNHFCFFG